MPSNDGRHRPGDGHRRRRRSGPSVAVVYGLAYGLAGGLVRRVSRGQAPSYVEIRFRGTLSHFLRRFAIGVATGLAVGIAFGVPPAAVIIEGLAFGVVVAVHMFGSPNRRTSPACPVRLPSLGRTGRRH